MPLRNLRTASASYTRSKTPTKTSVAIPSSLSGTGSSSSRTAYAEDCDGCAYDWSDFGAESCDAAWDAFGIDCATLESNYSWDCSGCGCPGDGDPVCGDGVCNGDDSSCEIYIETSLTTTVDEGVLDDIETS